VNLLIHKLILLAIILALPMPVFGAPHTSPNYSIDQDNPSPSSFDIDSPSYSIEGSIDSIVGSSDSASYDIQHGNARAGEEEDEPVVVQGGGGGQMFPPESVGGLDVNRIECGVYLTPYLLAGSRHQNTDSIFVNDDDTGVNLPTATSWQKLIRPAIGSNHYSIVAHNNYGWSDPVELDVYRKRLGDANDDGVVDDADLSTLAAYFQSNYCIVDFNHDNIVDDADLSLLASQWTR